MLQENNIKLEKLLVVILVFILIFLFLRKSFSAIEQALINSFMTEVSIDMELRHEGLSLVL